ncbi:MAG: protein translocase subunit SecD [Actinobacteria bacterium]|nr:protein translocase subunit SecD [Actinomycetota bacterium]
MKRGFGWRVFLSVVVLAGAAFLVFTEPIRLGLDLRGGTQIVLEAQDTEERTVNEDTVSRTLEVMRRRVDQLGVSEPTIQESGDRRIIIELPGVSDPDEALEVIGRTAQLTFHPVLGLADPEDEDSGREGRRGDRQRDEGGQDEDQDVLELPDEDGQRIRLDEARLTGDAVGDAQAIVNTQVGAQWQVSISFRGDGGDRWAEVTGEAACEPVGSPQRRVAIVLDREVLSSPQVDEGIECDVGIPPGGDTVITGDFTESEAKDLALLIRAGALPVPVEVVEQRTIGPTLGDAAIDASVQAALIGGLLTILYVIAYYRALGVLAAIALLAYGLISYAVLLAIGATLTLPGIAGFVLAIGMAVDANVLIFERGKEEFVEGRRLRTALSRGFDKAWSAIADSNATTVLAAIILFFFASGAVRGFGLTLVVGVAASMFSAILITRVLVDLATRVRALESRPNLFGMNVGGRLRNYLKEHPFDIMSRSRIWFGLSLALLALAVAGLVSRGLNFGLEFTGGRLIEYSTAQEVDLDELRSELAGAGFPRAVVQESGSGNVSVRAADVSDTEDEAIAQAVEAVGGSAEVVRDEFIGPTIGDELRRSALIALGLGLGVQLIFLAFRFRWTYGASAVMAMFHDLIILVGIFAWLGKDIDGVFVAALLTVIGYSINDSVVIFDRIREQRRLRSREAVAVVTNDACLQTIPRTINTGMGALFILFALYFLGGETLTDFAFALIVGILAGTYSSVFAAAPLVVAFENFADRKQPAASARSARTPAPKSASSQASTPKASASAGASTSGSSGSKRKGGKSKKRSGKKPARRGR